MTTHLMLAIAAGALLGVGITVCLAAASPAHPHLADALAAMDERTPSAAEIVSRRSRLVLPVLRQLPGLVPDTDPRRCCRIQQSVLVWLAGIGRGQRGT
jgi:hypothetical protein